MTHHHGHHPECVRYRQAYRERYGWCPRKVCCCKTYE